MMLDVGDTQMQQEAKEAHQ